jgi:hypothetical protein
MHAEGIKDGGINGIGAAIFKSFGDCRGLTEKGISIGRRK